MLQPCKYRPRTRGQGPYGPENPRTMNQPESGLGPAPSPSLTKHSCSPPSTGETDGNQTRSGLASGPHQPPLLPPSQWKPSQPAFTHIHIVYNCSMPLKHTWKSETFGTTTSKTRNQARTKKLPPWCVKQTQTRHMGFQNLSLNNGTQSRTGLV